MTTQGDCRCAKLTPVEMDFGLISQVLKLHIWCFKYLSFFFATFLSKALADVLEALMVGITSASQLCFWIARRRSFPPSKQPEGVALSRRCVHGTSWLMRNCQPVVPVWDPYNDVSRRVTSTWVQTTRVFHGFKPPRPRRVRGALAVLRGSSCHFTGSL